MTGAGLVPYVLLDEHNATTSSFDCRASATNETSARSFVSLNYSTPMMVVVASLLSVVIAATVFGNLLVGLALFRFRSLRTVSNFLIGNLALSDFLLATAVLPLSTANECLGHWVFGRIACNVWLLVDVLCCTASLWNICIIALDRYTATLYPIWYRERRSSHQALIYVAIVWTLSTAVCVPPLLGWNDLAGNYVRDNATDVYRCILFQSPSYVLYSASGSFFVPFFLTVFLYVQIFIVLRKRMKKMRLATGSVSSNKANSKKIRTATLSVNAASRPNETSVLLPAETIVQTAADGRTTTTAVEMTHVKVTEDRLSLKSLCSETAPDGTSSSRDKVIKVTDAVVDIVQLQSNNVESARDGGSKLSKMTADCSNCFSRRSAPEDGSDDTAVAAVTSGPNRRMDDDQLDPTDIEDDEATSIRTGVSRTPQVAAVIAMAGRRGRRRLGEIFLRISGTANAERTAQGRASAARRLEQREMQATIRMAIIIAFFCGMWLGFFTLYVINSWCPSTVCSVPRALDAFFFWLGYSNSSINPILYTIFNDDFRRAFRKLLGCAGAEAGERGGQLDRRGATSMVRSGRI